MPDNRASTCLTQYSFEVYLHFLPVKSLPAGGFIGNDTGR